MSILWATLVTLLVGAAGTLLLLLLGSAMFVYFATRPPRRAINRTPAEIGAAYEDVSFSARDGVRLSGWYLPLEKPRAAIILCHGMSANRTEMLTWARTLREQGFALLLFDFRALGESEGNRSSGGYFEPLDLHGAIDYLTARPEIAELPLGVFGFSMGGATAILTAADNSRVQAVATHGAFASLDRAIKQRCRRHFGPLAPLANWFTLSFLRQQTWLQVPPAMVSPVKAAALLGGRPLLLLHGSRDRTIHVSDARALHEAATGPKQLHILPRSGHRKIHRSLRGEAHARVAQFFVENLTDAHPTQAVTFATEIPRTLSRN